MKREEKILHDFLSKGVLFDVNELQKLVKENKVVFKTLQGLERVGKEYRGLDEEKSWKRIQNVLRQQRHRRMWWRVVAVAIILISICGSIFVSEMVEQVIPEMLVENEPVKQVQLILADGDVFELTNIAADTMFSDGSADIQVKSREGITYTGEDCKTDTLIYNTLRVPRGNEYHLVLADRTEVLLNSGSELRFPVNFLSDERKIYLKGEAYFKVMRDSLRPFRVMAEEMSVEVLGTSFNVNSHRDGGKLLATLETGSVRVRDTISGFECILKPGQQVALQNGEGSVRDVNLHSVLAWKDGCFLFEEMSLELIVKELERWFDVEFMFGDNKLKSYPFTGVVKRYNTIENVCDLLGETTDLSFKITGKKIVVSKK